MSNVPTFISIYDNALSKDECYEIVNEFETSKDKQKHGVTGPTYEPDPSNKISTEITYFLVPMGNGRRGDKMYDNWGETEEINYFNPNGFIYQGETTQCQK